MRTRLIVAFSMVALLSVLATAWFDNLIRPYYSLPAWLSDPLGAPRLLMHLLYTQALTSGGSPRGNTQHPPLLSAMA